MTSHHEKRTVPYAPDQLFDLVADVKKYPEFLPWCVGARIRSKEERLVIADLLIGYKLVRERFTSKVILDRKNKVIETEFGKVDCMVFKPKMQEGRVFEDGEEMKIWISDDKNHLLMKVETKIWAGTIKAVLVDYKQLKFPLSIIQ